MPIKKFQIIEGMLLDEYQHTKCILEVTYEEILIRNPYFQILGKSVKYL